MNPLSVRARNYRTFESVELELPGGTVAIVGDNGAGKSSVVNIVELALFGSPRGLAPYLRDSGESTELELGLVFEHGDEVYRVRRGYSARGRGKSTLDLERYDPVQILGTEGITPRWTPFTRETTKATQDAIERLLGLSRETFRASAFLAQGDGAAFTEAEPRERKRILAEVLGLGVWDELLARVRRDKAAVEEILQKSAGRLEELERGLEASEEVERSEKLTRQIRDEAIAGRDAAQVKAREAFEAHRQALELQTVLSERQSATRQATRAVEQERARLQELDVALAAVAEAGERLGPLEETASRVAALESSLDDLRSDAQVYAREIAEFGERERRRRELGVTIGNLERREAEAVREVERLVEGIKAARAPRADCPTCGQAVTDAAAERVIAKLEAQIRTVRETMEQDAAEHAAAGRELEELPPLPRPAEPEHGPAWEGAVKAELVDARRAGVALELLRERIRSKPELEARRRDTAAEVERLAELAALARDAERKAEVDAGEVERLERASSLAERELELEGRRLQGAELELGRLQERREILERARGIRDELLAAREKDDRLLALLLLAERAYGRDGVPALIVEAAAIPQIEVEASRILEALGTTYRIELQTQRATKTGEGLREVLEIVVHGDGGERLYETFSGGERTRVNLALRIALARLLAHRRGARVEMLALDEPEALDEAGYARLGDVLRGMSGDFEKILLISHHPALRDSLDSTIEVVKDGDRSRIAG